MMTVMLVRLNQDVCSKKVQAFVNTGFVFKRVETKGGSVFTSAKISISLLIFKRKKGGRDENVSTLPYNEL